MARVCAVTWVLREITARKDRRFISNEITVHAFSDIMRPCLILLLKTHDIEYCRVHKKWQTVLT